MTNEQSRNTRPGLRIVMILLVALTAAVQAADPPQRPNVLFILADDLGPADLGCYGGKVIPTPSLDRLAAEGMRFTQHYAGGTVCGPSRSSLLTGQHTGRAFQRGNPGQVAANSPLKGLPDKVGRASDFPLRAKPEDRVCLPEIFKAAGYRTAVVGKWGLGNPGTPGDPQAVGFDEFFGLATHVDAHTYHPAKLWDNGEYVKNKGKKHLHPQYTQRAIDFISRHKETPFFLYLAYQFPHGPYKPHDSLRDEPFAKKHGLKGQARVYASQVAQMDRSIGNIVEKIEELGIAKNTLVIFASDNGWGGNEAGKLKSTGSFRDRKGSLYEGGMRSPMIARWPNQIKAGTTSDFISAFWDFMPTFAELTGQEIPEQTTGVSLLPVLQGTSDKARPEAAPIYFEWSRTDRAGQSIRVGDWKLIRWLNQPEPVIELFNLVDDESETSNLAKTHPDHVKRLLGMMQEQHVPNKHFPLPIIDSANATEVERASTPSQAHNNAAKRPAERKPSSFVQATEAKQPNIVYVMADDLGWADVGCNGAKFYETPNIDALCASGMKFNSAYPGASNCMPSRACIMSGMYTPRTQMWTPGTRAKGDKSKMKLLVPRQGDAKGDDVFPSKQHLDPSVVSVAEVLGRAGYRTAHFGKWHLGPNGQGFDVNDTNGLGAGLGKKFYSNIDVAENLTTAACKFIKDSKDGPFFIYLCHWDVHSPIRARKEVIEKYKKKLASDDWDRNWNPTYAAMIEAVDVSVGRLRETLEKNGLAENTLFMFTSDNGGAAFATWCEPLKGAKGAFYEGGIRVPTCVSWPKVVKPGSVCDVPITGVDIMPTFAELAGAKLPAKQPVDGQSWAPLLAGNETKDQAIFWHYPLYLRGSDYNRVVPVHGTSEMYWRATPCSVIRQGDWKLIQFFEDDSVELYNLKEDIGEKKNLAKSNPEKAADLLRQLKAWQTSTKAVIPTKENPDFGSKESGETKSRKRKGAGK